MLKNPPANAGDIQSLGWEDPLEKGMATHSNILAWRSSWTEEPGGLQSTGLQELDKTEQLSTHQLHLYTFFSDSVLDLLGSLLLLLSHFSRVRLCVTP